ncbi:hypothetical protein GGF41_008090, partial [Coemansia sp. RSA 2531]
SKIPPEAGGPRMQMRANDCGYMLEEIWRGRSAISGSIERLALTRWRRDQPMATYNCVCMTKPEADRHEKLTGDLEDHYPAETLEYIERRLDEEKQLSKWR